MQSPSKKKVVKKKKAAKKKPASRKGIKVGSISKKVDFGAGIPGAKEIGRTLAKRDADLFVRIKPSNKKWAEVQAQANGVTLSSWVDQLLDVTRAVKEPAKV